MWWYLQMLTIGIGTVVLEAFLDGYKPKCKHCRQPWWHHTYDRCPVGEARYERDK